jgi:hypothetical protein
LDIGIIGLKESGKTTVFNALSKGKATPAKSQGKYLKPVVGIAKVPDGRVDKLDNMFKPQSTVFAEVKFIDVALAPGNLPRMNQDIAGELLNLLEGTDALLQIVRKFDNHAVPHPNGLIDPHKDLEDMNFELAFADLAILEKRLNRLESDLKGATSQEREVKQKEQALLNRIKTSLEADIPIRSHEISFDEHKLLQNYQFLTAKPMLLAWNIGEGDLDDMDNINHSIREIYLSPNIETTVICGKLEMDLSEINDSVEEDEFRKMMGVKESGLNSLIRSSYRLLGLISFFTVGSDEVRAWTIQNGTKAVDAASKIHSDISRGFIRAEVISYDDFTECGSIAEGKKRGLLRAEGKTYEIQDGDIINFLFNV